MEPNLCLSFTCPRDIGSIGHKSSAHGNVIFSAYRFLKNAVNFKAQEPIIFSFFSIFLNICYRNLTFPILWSLSGVKAIPRIILIKL